MKKNLLENKIFNEYPYHLFTFENILKINIENSFYDVCCERGYDQTAGALLFLFAFIQAMYEADFFDYDTYEDYVNNPEKLQSDFIAEYKEVKNIVIDKYHLIGILHYLTVNNLLVSSIEASEESSLSRFIKSLPDDILSKMSDPLEERYLDHLCFYYDYDDNDELLWCMNLHDDLQKIADRDFDNLSVYFNPEQLYYYGEEQSVFSVRARI